VLKAQGENGQPKVLNIFGGKITTYRRLAESMMELVGETIGAKGESWTKGAKLPGGDFPTTGFADLLAETRSRYPFLKGAQSERMVKAYGTNINDILGDAVKAADLGKDFGHGLTTAEVSYMMENEWARTADDVLWRRSKLGIRFSAKEKRALDDWMAKHRDEIRHAAE